MEPFGIDGGDVARVESRTGLAKSFQSCASRPLTRAFSQQPPYGDGAPDDLASRLTRQLTHMMNVGPQEEMVDEVPWGQEHSPLVHYLGDRLLRGGLLTQVIALVLQCIFFLAFGGNGWYDFNIFAAPDALKGTEIYVYINAVLDVAYLVGVVQVAAFQVLVADNSKWSLGFRAGSKLLACSCSLDVAAAALRVASGIHFSRFVSARWLGRHQQMSGEWSLFHLGGTIHGIAMLTYGFAFAALEMYHDKGTNALYATIMFILFPIASITRLAGMYFGVSSLGSLCLLAALVVAYMWSVDFEPLIERWSPELHSRRIEDNILPNPRTDEPAQGAAQVETYTYAAIPEDADGQEEPLSRRGTAPLQHLSTS